MTKKQSINVISKCAKLYEEHLCDKQIMFVYRDADNHVHYTEVRFRSYNFMHLTGVSPRKELSANDFYRYSLHGRLRLDDFEFKSNFTTELKLQVLDIIMKIPYSARMIGNYAGPYVDLYTEKVTGTTTACLGLIQQKDFYIPNSAIKEDIRDIIERPPGKVFAIFRKNLSNSLYSELTYRSKNIVITEKCMPDNIKALIEPSLLKDSEIVSFK